MSMKNGKTKEEEDEPSIGGMLTAAAVAAAGIGFAAWGVSKVFGSTSEEQPIDDRKKMIAPGSGGEIIYRDDFERDTPGYFRRLHQEEKQPIDDRKTMKAPGSGGEIIYRDDFERDTPGYFRRLHQEQKQPIDDRKTMKGPGSGGKIIYRDDFERDARGYFSQRREEEKNKK